MRLHCRACKRVCSLRARSVTLYCCVQKPEQKKCKFLEARASLRKGFEDIKRYDNLHPWVPIGMNHSMRRIEAEIERNSELIEIVGQRPSHR